MFDTTNRGPVTPEAFVPSAAGSTPEPIQHLERLFLAELEHIELFEAERERARQRWAGTGVSVPYEIAELPIRSLATEVIKSTVDVATTLLSQPGAPAQIDVSEWIDRTVETPGTDAVRRANCRPTGREQALAQAQEPWRRFRPSELWAQICLQYPPEVVERQARTLAAAHLVDLLALRRTDVRHVGGRAEICLHMQSEPDYRDSSKRKYKCYGSDMQRQLPSAMTVFATASDLDADVEGLLELAHKLIEVHSWNFMFSSRDRHELPGGAGVVCFNNALKIYLPEHIAIALNIFVSTYAPGRLW